MLLAAEELREAASVCLRPSSEVVKSFELMLLLFAEVADEAGLTSEEVITRDDAAEELAEARDNEELEAEGNEKVQPQVRSRAEELEMVVAGVGVVKVSISSSKSSP